MMFSVLLTNLLANVLLPPFVFVLLLVVALLTHRRQPRCSMLLIVLTAASLYALSTPWFSGVLQKSLEISQPIDLAAPPHADAIVVLGGGRRIAALEYDGDTLNRISFERLRYAARMQRATHLPLLVTGGKPDGGTIAEGDLMRRALTDEFHVPVHWIERAALTTLDNARLSAPILKHAKIKRILLISHAWHLRRAVPQFERQGLEVIPAGIDFASTRLDSAFDLIPSAAGLLASTYALHEWLGILWYQLRNQLDQRQGMAS
jgi:uncharacterized SAM-binding protein YcdF (DUF218 family)